MSTEITIYLNNAEPVTLTGANGLIGYEEKDTVFKVKLLHSDTEEEKSFSYLYFPLTDIKEITFARLKNHAR